MDQLMIFATNLPSTSQATSFFDPGLCSLTFGIPVVASGEISATGINNNDSMSVCNDINATLAVSSIKLPPGSAPTSLLNPENCTFVIGVPEGERGVTGPAGPQGFVGPQGPAGPPGLPGINCWDLNGDRINDPSEDTNNDGIFDAKDCHKKEK